MAIPSRGGDTQAGASSPRTREERSIRLDQCRIRPARPRRLQELFALQRSHEVRTESDASVRAFLEAEMSRDSLQRELRREVNELKAQAARDRDAVEAVMRMVKRVGSTAVV